MSLEKIVFYYKLQDILRMVIIENIAAFIIQNIKSKKLELWEFEDSVKPKKKIIEDLDRKIRILKFRW